MSKVSVSDNAVQSILTAQVGLVMYVAGENVPAQISPKPAVQRKDGKPKRVLSLTGSGDMHRLEVMAWDAAQALLDWQNGDRSIEAVRGYIRRVVNDEVEIDGLTAWVLLDAGKAPSPATVRECRASGRDVLLWLAERGICPAECSVEDMRSYKAYLQAEGSALEMELLRARWYGRAPRLAYKPDDRTLLLGLALAVWRRVKLDITRTNDAKSNAARRLQEALTGSVVTIGTVLYSFRVRPPAVLHQNYADDTVALRITMTRSFFKLALARKAVYENPCLDLKVTRGSTARSQQIISRFFSDREVHEILAMMREEDKHSLRDKAAATRNTAIVRLGRNHGLRISEVVNLDLEDYNPTAGEFGSLLLREAKGRKTRTVFLTEKTRISLERWLLYRALVRTNSLALFLSLHKGGKADRRQPGDRMDARSVRGMFDFAQREAGLKRGGRSFHGLRHRLRDASAG